MLNIFFFLGVIFLFGSFRWKIVRVWLDLAKIVVALIKLNLKKKNYSSLKSEYYTDLGSKG